MPAGDEGFTSTPSAVVQSSVSLLCWSMALVGTFLAPREPLGALDNSFRARFLLPAVADDIDDAASEAPSEADGADGRARGERVERRVDARVGEKMSIAVMRERDRSKERRHPSRRVDEIDSIARRRPLVSRRRLPSRPSTRAVASVGVDHSLTLGLCKLSNTLNITIQYISRHP